MFPEKEKKKPRTSVSRLRKKMRYQNIFGHKKQQRLKIQNHLDYMVMIRPITNRTVDKSRVPDDILPEAPVYISTLVLTKFGPQPDWMKSSISGIFVRCGSSPAGETYQLRSVEPLRHMCYAMVGFYFQQK